MVYRLCGIAACQEVNRGRGRLGSLVSLLHSAFPMNFPRPQLPLRAVVFDLDGLMFNTEDLYQHVGTEILARRDKLATDELFAQMMGRQSDVALQVMIDWHHLDDTVEQLTAESADIMAGLLPQRLAPMPGLLPLLDALEAAGIPMAIATSSDQAFLKLVLGQFQLAPRFSFLLAAESVVCCKPAPDVYLLAAQKHGLPPAEIMVLEDSQIGCQAATAAGAYTVAVPEGRSESHCFQGVQFIAHTLGDARIQAALGLLPWGAS